MVGILIIAHGTLGESLIRCATHVLGLRPVHVMQFSVDINDDPQQVIPLARHLVDQVNVGDGVLVLSDLFGATPSNIAAKLVDPGHVEGVAGISLPMLVRALTYRNEPLAVVVKKAMSGGMDGVMQLPCTNSKDASTGS